MPRSAPLASASLMVCLARSGPIEMAMTSPPCFSFRRSASSSAKLSGSFISNPMSVSRIHAPPSAIARGASLAGTCLMQTTIFTCLRSLQRDQRRVPALEEQRGVGAAETERIRERVLDLGFARVVRNVIEIALRIGSFLVDRRRQNLIAQRQHADARLEAARAAEQMPGHGLGRADGNFLGVVAEDALQRGRLDRVAQRRRSAVRVDVADMVRRDLRILDRREHHAIGAIAFLGRLRDVVRVAGHSVADDFGENLRAAALGEFERLRESECPRLRRPRSRRARASNGRLARSGSSLRVESAFIAANPPMPIGVIAASEPPRSSLPHRRAGSC